jgi:AAA15 family ATPase/GTPase
MYINSLKLKCFKGFSKEPTILTFNKPNGEKGSGLNILIGENNCGKSTILEAVEFLREGSKKSQDVLIFKAEIEEQKEHAEVELEFEGEIQNTISMFAQPNKVKVFSDRI